MRAGTDVDIETISVEHRTIRGAAQSLALLLLLFVVTCLPFSRYRPRADRSFMLRTPISAHRTPMFL